MINIINKDKCCGCGACMQVCPRSCIKMLSDTEGFLYPLVDSVNCIKCGLCEQVCPELNEKGKQSDRICYTIASIHKCEKILEKSSSGGFFVGVAEFIIKNGGVVYGASFDEKWGGIHICVEKLEDLKKIQGSKYVQSSTDNTFKDVLINLKKGRIVLYSGTPCQIAGLKSYLRVDYKKLYTLEIICHGVPSPLVWNLYLKENYVYSKIKSINLRYKKPRWDKYSFAIEVGNKKIVEPSSHNLFLRGFLSDVFLRPSCYTCSFKSFKSNADCTIGDFWGVRDVLPSINVDDGCSCVICHTEKMKECIDSLNINVFRVSYDQILCANPSLEYSSNLNEEKRNEFFYDLSHKPFSSVQKKWMDRGTIRKIKDLIKKYLILNK